MQSQLLPAARFPRLLRQPVSHGLCQRCAGRVANAQAGRRPLPRAFHAVPWRAVVAFLSKLPALSPRDYAQAVEERK